MSATDLAPPDIQTDAPPQEIPCASTDDLKKMRMNQRRAELDAMREKKSPNARQKYRVSRLYRYRHDLVALRECGASYGEIREWLKQYKKVTVATSTVLRFLASLQGVIQSGGPG